MQVKNVVFLIFLFLFISKVYFLFPITSDAFERMRIANEIISTQKFPFLDISSIPERINIYPPLFDVFLSNFSLITGFDTLFSNDILSYILTLIFILSLLLLTQNTYVPLLVFSSPWIFHRFITPISETMALAFLPLAIYYSKNRKMAVLASFLLFLTHYRTAIFFTFFIVFFEIVRKNFKLAVFSSIALSSIFFFIPKFFNPLVATQNVFDVLGIVISLVLLWLPFSKSELVLSLILADIPLLFLMPNSFRQFLFLFLPAALIYKDLHLKVTNFMPAVVSILLLANLAYYSPPTDYAKLSLILTTQKLDAKNIASSYTDAYQLAYANKSVILGAFAESLPNVESRVTDLAAILNGNKTIASNYNISYIFTERKLDLPVVATNGFYNIYSLVNKANATVA